MSVVTGVSISTLRYYDKEKILTPAMRNEKRIAGVINSPGRLIIQEPEEPEDPEEIVDHVEPTTDPNNSSEPTVPSESYDLETKEGIDNSDPGEAKN